MLGSRVCGGCQAAYTPPPIPKTEFFPPPHTPHVTKRRNRYPSHWRCRRHTHPTCRNRHTPWRCTVAPYPTLHTPDTYMRLRVYARARAPMPELHHAWTHGYPHPVALVHCVSACIPHPARGDPACVIVCATNPAHPARAMPPPRVSAYIARADRAKRPDMYRESVPFVPNRAITLTPRI